MPDGNRSKRPPTWVGWAVGVLGLALAAFSVGFGLSEQRRYFKEAHQAGSEYARYAADQAGQSCRVLADPEQSKCLTDAEREYEMKRRDNRRDYADLVAQQTSALWTSIMGVAAVTGMMLSVVGVWLVFATFRETRRTADEAWRGANEANLSRLSFIERERAHLNFNRASVSLGHPGRLSVILNFSNDGTGMAEIDAAAFEWWEGETWPDGGLDFAEGLQVKIAGDTNGHLIVGPSEPVRCPALLLGFVRYRTLTIEGCRAHFCLSIDASDTSHGEAPYVATKIELGGMPHDT